MDEHNIFPRDENRYSKNGFITQKNKYVAIYEEIAGELAGRKSIYDSYRISVAEKFANAVPDISEEGDKGTC